MVWVILLHFSGLYSDQCPYHTTPYNISVLWGSQTPRAQDQSYTISVRKCRTLVYHVMVLLVRNRPHNYHVVNSIIILFYMLVVINRSGSIATDDTGFHSSQKLKLKTCYHQRIDCWKIIVKKQFVVCFFLLNPGISTCNYED